MIHSYKKTFVPAILHSKDKQKAGLQAGPQTVGNSNSGQQLWSMKRNEVVSLGPHALGVSKEGSYLSCAEYLDKFRWMALHN